MRVMHVISSGGMYGAEAVVLNLLREMQASTNHGMLAAFDNAGNPQLALYRKALEFGIEAYPLPCRRQIDPDTVSALNELAKRTQADVVHAHGYKADVYTCLAARISRWTFVSTCHSWCGTGLSTRIYNAVDRLALRRASGVVAVSAEVQQQLVHRNIKPDRIALIRNGISQLPFQPGLRARSDNASRITTSPKIGFAGRLSPEKGCDLFLQAARGILADLPQAHFLIAGDGPDRAMLESAIEQHDLTHAVTLLGRCDDMPAFYESIDLLLSTSRMEGLPIALMEAMSSGLPVVATSVGDVPALIESEVTGLLFAPDDIQGLVYASVALLRDPERCLDYGQAGALRVATHFSVQQMTSQYVAMYEKLLSGSGLPV